MKKSTILGVQVTKRCQKATEIQDIFSSYGCSIRTRIGLHSSAQANCSPGGLIIIEAIGNSDEINQLRNKLSEIEGVIVKSMEFTLE